MKLFQAMHQYAYDWATVTAAHWQKYPNDKTPHVIHVETLNRTVDPVTGILKTERLIMCQQSCPRIVARLLGADSTSYVLEYSEVDPKNQTLKAVSTNLTLHDLLAVNEEIVYTPKSENLSHTVFQQSATITAFNMISKVSGYVEDFSVKRFKENASIGKTALEQVMERLVQKKVTTTT